AGAHPAVAAALAARARARAQRGQLDRLRRGVDASIVRLPLVFAPALGPEALGELATRLGRVL
ncbi:MAG TPA: hypothetical protein VLB47_01310, partial [Solirubrobacteraceae bacterium]|nr:hypothetical protein [Solirubrobacteraceae bacterium]